MKADASLLRGFFLSLALSAFAVGETLYQAERPVQTNSAVEVTTAPIPVPPGGKIQLAFSGRSSGRHTIEANERVRILEPRYTASRLRLQFYDGKGEIVAGGATDVFILTQSLHEYVRFLYPPPEARTFRISVRPGRDAELLVRGLTVSTDLPARERESINPHPTFEHGDLDTYGCLLGYGGRFYTRPDGKTVWKTGFLGYSPAFPVEPGRFYAVTCQGRKYRGRKSYVLLDCHNGNDRTPVKSMRVAMSNTGETTEVKIPVGTVFARLRCYCVILETVRVVVAEEPE